MPALTPPASPPGLFFFPFFPFLPLPWFSATDIFLNILTTTGLVERYLTDYVGEAYDVGSINVRLGAPAYPYDTLVFTGEVSAIDGDEVHVSVVGAVTLGAHVTAHVLLWRRR